MGTADESGVQPPCGPAAPPALWSAALLPDRSALPVPSTNHPQKPACHTHGGGHDAGI